jgi:hypothetical protein
LRPKFLSKDGVDEWTALFAIIVEKYLNLCKTIVNNRKVCVDNNTKMRAHQSTGGSRFYAHSDTKKNVGHMVHGF